MKIFVAFLMVLLAAAAQDSGAGTELERPRILCGRTLANARMLYCISSESDTRKRFSETPLAGPSFPRWHSSWWPQLVQDSEQAQALRSKREPGLVDECCYKPCYVSELLNYC